MSKRIWSGKHYDNKISFNKFGFLVRHDIDKSAWECIINQKNEGELCFLGWLKDEDITEIFNKNWGRKHFSEFLCFLSCRFELWIKKDILKKIEDIIRFFGLSTLLSNLKSEDSTLSRLIKVIAEKNPMLLLASK